MIETLTGQVLMANGDSAAALRVYRDAIRQYPTYRALVYDYADALLRIGDPANALKVAQDRLQVAPNDYRAYLLQGRAYAALNRTLLAHQSRAEAFVRVGNLREAIVQLQIGIKAGDGTFHELSSAEARLRELRRADDELRKDQKGR
jgi:predicted Zn-dependent protease